MHVIPTSNQLQYLDAINENTEYFKPQGMMLQRSVPNYFTVPRVGDHHTCPHYRNPMKARQHISRRQHSPSRCVYYETSVQTTYSDPRVIREVLTVGKKHDNFTQTAINSEKQKVRNPSHGEIVAYTKSEKKLSQGKNEITGNQQLNENPKNKRKIKKTFFLFSKKPECKSEATEVKSNAESKEVQTKPVIVMEQDEHDETITNECYCYKPRSHYYKYMPYGVQSENTYLPPLLLEEEMLSSASSLISLDVISDKLTRKFYSMDGAHKKKRAPIPSSFKQQSSYWSDPEDRYVMHQVKLDEKEKSKVESFYKSVGSLVHVAASPATLFCNDFDATSKLTEWRRLYVGVPLWLFNTGMNSKRPRRLQLVMGELGSGFILIDATVDYSSDVRYPKPGHITLRTKDGNSVLALKFFNEDAASSFYEYYQALCMDKRNADIFNVRTKDASHQPAGPTFRCRVKRVTKRSISTPTSFKHLSSIHEENKEKLYSLAALV